MRILMAICFFSFSALRHNRDKARQPLLKHAFCALLCGQLAPTEFSALLTALFTALPCTH